jgi:antitoxin component YwqK of YwqJK toxin-antitoxin module
MKLKQSKKMRITTAIFIIIALSSSKTYSQDIITKYYDSSWHVSAKDSAIYYATFQKEDTVYRVTSYWVRSNKLNGVSTYADTNFRVGIGLQKRYYESGALQDSIYFSNKGNIETGYRYKENGQLDYRIFSDPKNGGISGEHYDSAGNKIPGYFTFQKEAMFPGGSNAWLNYMYSNLKTDIAARHKAPVGKYTVTISFLVDKNGKVGEVKALVDPGYGTAEEVMRVIKKSPDWIPAIQNDKPVIYRQKQNITFQVTED